MIINKGKKMLLLRYSDFLYDDCISDHIDVIESRGYCWFGKVGKQKPSLKFRNTVLKDDVPMVFLHSSKKAYICNIADIIYDKPDDNAFPDYYYDFLFNAGIEPCAYIKLTSCKEINKSVLYSFVVSISRNCLPEALRKSMNSLFLIECDEDVEI